MFKETGIIVIDIETVPGDNMPDFNDFHAPSNYKDPVKIENYKIEKANESYLKQGLKSYKGKILCIGFKINDNAVHCIHHLDEKRMLETFTEVLKSYNGLKFIGHNVTFDLGFLFHRALHYGLTDLLNELPTDKKGYFDTMTEANPYERNYKISLKNLCELLNIPSPKSDIDGSKVFDYYKAGKIDEIMSYCSNDVTATRAVYDRLKNLLCSI